MKNNVQKRRSITASAFSALVNWFYSMAAGGLFGKLFTSYTKMNEVFKKSFAVSLIGNGSRAAGEIRKFRFRIAELFEGSAILRLLRRLAAFLIGCRVRFYGSFTVIFGIYTGLIYLLKRYAFDHDSSDQFYLWFAVGTVIVSIPLLICGKTVAQMMTESRAGNFIITEFFGIQQEKLEVAPSRHGDSYNIAMIFGLFVGSVTYFISPIYIVGFLAVLLTVAIVMSYPEIGVLLTALILPFAGAFGDRGTVLLSSVALYSVAYLFKLIRGKRVLKLNVYDFFMLAFGVIALLGGAFGTAGEVGISSAVSMFLLVAGGFIALNLLRTAEWLRRCGFSIFTSAFAVSLLVLWECFSVRLGLDAYVSLGSLTFFSSQNDTAVYLLMSFGVALAILRLTEQRKLRFLVRLGTLAIPAAILALGSKSGALGVFVAFIVYCIINRKKTVGVLIAGAGAAAYIGFMMPERMLFGFFDMWNDFVLSLWRAVAVWQGAIGAALSAFLIGAGVGSFESIYPKLAFAGSENAAEASSLSLSMLCELGILGFVVFLFVMILFSQSCFEYMKTAQEHDSRVMTSSGLAAVLGVLTAGMFYDVFSDLGAFYMFWLLSSFTVACIRVGRAEAMRSADNQPPNETAASIDIPN